jgi:hypothetical protein
MTDLIHVVKGDEKPDIIFSIVDKFTGKAEDLSSSTTSVTINFRNATDTTVLSVINCTKVGDGTDGRVTFNFTGGVLDVDAGQYEGDIIVSYNGDILTLYDTLAFRVRDR